MARGDGTRLLLVYSIAFAATQIAEYFWNASRICPFDLTPPRQSDMAQIRIT